MRNDTHTYPTYKLCSIPQICQIPSHWEVKRLAQMGTFSKGGGGTKDDEAEHGLPCIRYGDIYTSHKYFATQSRSRIHPDRTPNYARIKYGDVLFAGSGETIEDIGKSVVSLIEEEAYCGGDVILFRPTVQVHPRFMGYTLDSPPFAFQKSSMGRGITIMHIYSSQLKNMCIPLPPLDEQAAIVRYLDHTDDLINRYISAKERLIALLEEQRQAIIDQAVMRGLDPNVRLKTSGIQWLGDVPQHWKVRKLKQVCSQQGQYGANIPASEYTTSGIRFLRTTDISADGDVVGEGVYIRLNLSPEHILNTGDILLTRSGATVGQSFLYDKERHGKCSFAGYLIRFSPSPEILPKFVYLFTTTARFQNPVQQSAIVSTIENVNAEKYANIHMPIPPFDEQMDIVQHLDELTRQIDTTIAGTGRQIELMGEYRTRLIADAVTGQIDVRNATIEVPGQHL